MNFEKNKLYFLKFFYTGFNFNVCAPFSGLTEKPQSYIDEVFNHNDFDEGFVIIRVFK